MAGTFKCGHCGKDHEEGTKFCPDTGKSLGPAAGAKKTMLMFQQPGTKLPGSSAPAAGPAQPPPAAPPHGPPTGTPGAHPRPHAGSAAAPTIIGAPAVLVPQSGSGSLPRTPAATPPTRSPSPSTGVPVPSASGNRPSGPIRIPTPSGSRKDVPPPPVRTDGVPPPITTPAEGVPVGDASGASGPRRSKSVPDWVATPQGGPGGAIPSVVLPAVDAPPKGIMDLLKDAFELYKQHLQVFLITAAVLFVPAALVSSGLLALIMAPMLIGSAAVAVDPSNPAAAGAAMGGIMLALVGVLAWVVAMFFLFALIIPLTNGALTVAVADRILGGDRGWQDYWRVLLGRLGKLLSALIPAFLLIFVGMFFLFIPGLVLAFFFSLVPAAVMIEGLGGMAALKRSYQLVKSDWLRVLLVFIVFGVINMVGHFVGGLFVPDRFFFFDALIGDLVTLVLLPVPVLATVLLYLDIRRTKENATRETLQAELDAVRTPG